MVSKPSDFFLAQTNRGLSKGPDNSVETLLSNHEDGIFGKAVVATGDNLKVVWAEFSTLL